MIFEINGIFLLLLLIPIFYPLYRMHLLRRERIRCQLYNLRHSIFIFACENNLIEDNNYHKLRNNINTTIQNIHKISLSGFIVFYITIKLFFSKKERKMFYLLGEKNLTIIDNDFKQYNEIYQKIIVKSLLSLPVIVVLFFTVIPIWFFKYTKNTFSGREDSSQKKQTEALNKWANSLALSFILK